MFEAFTATHAACEGAVAALTASVLKPPLTVSPGGRYLVHKKYKGADMGFFSALKLGSLFDKRINALGYNPRSLPPDLLAQICSTGERYYSGVADTCGLRGARKNDHIEGSIEATADLVVLLAGGPDGYRGYCSADEIIANLVKDMLQFGEQGTFHLQVLHHINQARLLDTDIAQAFIKERKRQQERGLVRGGNAA